MVKCLRLRSLEVRNIAALLCAKEQEYQFWASDLQFKGLR